MRPRWPGSKSIRLRPKLSTPSCRRSGTKRSPAARSRVAKEAPDSMPGQVTLEAMLDEADDLYGLPLGEFTFARDALAKRLRGEKRREDADFVKGLRRPSIAAGAINLAVRRHGADELLAAGEELQAAHAALLEGSGDAAAVREATAREREAVRDFARLALGDDASGATEEKVRATLHAASVDDEVRELLEAGRLEREAEAGVDAMALMASASARSSGAKKPSAR